MIVRLASRGEGVTADGRHVSLAAPGDAIDDDGAVIAGPHHLVPPCRHYPQCGGCQLQHVDDAAYADFIVERIASALGAQGVVGVEMAAPHLSPPRSRRRATLHFANTRGGNARGANARGRVGIGFTAGRTHDIVDMRECHILRPELFALVEPLRRLLRGRGKAGQVALTLVDGGVDVTIAGASFDGLAGVDALNGFADVHRLARLSVDEGFGPETRYEPAPVTVTLGGVPVPFAPGAFLQATADGEAVLVAAVRDAAGPAKHVADLFAGLGTFALSLDGRVLAVEGARDAALALKSAANRAGRTITVEHRDLFRRPLTAAELAGFEAVVLDPPRAGAREQVAEIGRSGVSRIVYVSCNPNTFGRDAKNLVESGYRVEWIRPVGQFRWSTHVELVAYFAR